MTQHDPAAWMQTGFDAIAAKDLDALSATHHDDIVEDFLVLGPIEGKAAVRAFFMELFAAVPDLEFVTERIFGVEDTVAVGQWTMKGTFTGGNFQGIEPTGRFVEIRGIDVMEFEDGLVRHNTIYYDGLSFARQVGLLPAAGGRGDRAILSTFNALTKAKSKMKRS